MTDLTCGGCPYWDGDDYCDGGDRLKRDALALLKAQAPRVLSLGEVAAWDGPLEVEERASGDRLTLGPHLEGEYHNLAYPEQDL